MKRVSLIIIVLLSMVATMGTWAKGGDKMVPKMYAYGVSTSFNDSTVFFTEIMELDSAWVEGKSGFIVSRDNYSYQLRDHLASKGYPKRTCIFAYGSNLKKVEKKYEKMKTRFVKRGGCDILLIDKSEFTFKPIVSYQQQQPETQGTAPEKPKDKPKHKGKRPEKPRR